MKGFLKKVLLLPLWPFWPMMFLLQRRSRTTRVLRQVLYLFGVLGMLSSFFAGMFVLGMIGEHTDVFKVLWKESEVGVLIAIGSSMVPFLFFGVLQFSAAYRVLRRVPDVPLQDAPGLSGMDTMARVLYALLAVAIVVVCVNLGALGLVLIGGLIAFIVTVAYGFLYLVLLVFSLGTILLAGDTGFWDRINDIWNHATFARHLFTYEEKALQFLEIDPKWAALAAIIAGYGIPTLLAIWVWVNRGKFRAAVPAPPASH